MIVEDGSGLPNSESYCSESFADTYHENRGNSDWDLVSDKEAALRKATDYMIQVYRQSWQGYRAIAGQALDWPRQLVYNNEYPEEISIASNLVPIEVKNACAELALKTYTDDVLYSDEEQKVTEEIIGPITIKYSDNSTTTSKIYSSINSILKPYFKSSSLSVVR